VVLNRGGTPPMEEPMNFQRVRALRALEHGNFESINSFAFTAYLKSGELETKDRYLREAC